MKYKLTKFIKKKDFVRLISIAIFLLGIILVVWISSFYMPFVKQPVKIGSTYMTLNNSFYKTINEEVKKQVSQNGDILYTRDPGLSVSKQCQQIYDFIDKKVDVILINPVNGESKQIQHALKIAHDKGIKIVVVDSQLSNSSFVNANVVSDNFKAGVLDAKYMMKSSPQAKILVLRHWNALSVKERYRGFVSEIKNNPNYQITENLETLGQTDVALKNVQELLKADPDKFDIIMAMDDQSAVGALAAMDALNLHNKIMVYGIDGSTNMKHLLLSNPNAQATVAQSPIKLGQKSIQVCYKLVKGKKVPKDVVVPVFLLTKKNINDYDVSGWQ